MVRRMSCLTITYSKKKRKRSGFNAAQAITSDLPVNVCCFCRSDENSDDEYGKIIKKCGFTVHYFCMLFSSGLSQGGKKETQGILGFMPKDIKRELKRGNRLRCTYCRDKGATIGCVVTSCRKVFHLTCGRKNGSLHQFYDSFRSYCEEHRPRQVSQVSDRLAFVGTANTVCSICMYAVVARASPETLRAPCCKNSWFHRQCVQRYAMSAGLYFFKCPLCNSKDLFQSEMLQYGIYIPDQDASWEREPNAFQDLYERYAHCDAHKCTCPNGRDHDEENTKWEIVVCEACGSCGTHVPCHGLEVVRKRSICADCIEIEQKVKKTKGKKGKANSKVKVRSQKEIKRLLDDRIAKVLKEKSHSRRGHSPSTAGVPDVCHVTAEETDKDVDIEASESDSDASETPRQKRRCLSVNVHSSSKRKRGSTSGISSTVQVEASGSSCSTSVETHTQGRNYSNYVTVSTVTNEDVRQWGGSDGNQGRLTLNNSMSYSDDSDDSDSMCAVDDVEEDASRKTVTIKWKGKKIQIYKEVEKDDEDDISKLSLHLEVGEDQPMSRSSSPGSDCNSPDSPPQLLPVDEEITFKCTPPAKPYMLGQKVLSGSATAWNADQEEYALKEEGPPNLSPVWNEGTNSSAYRVTRSMSVEGKQTSNNSCPDLSMSGYSRRSLAGEFSAEKEQYSSILPRSPMFVKRLKECDSESTCSAANSVITLSSNSDEESDCLIVEPVYVTENRNSKSHRRMSYEARMSIGSPFLDEDIPASVPYRRITSGNGNVGVVIDLTDSQSDTWESFAEDYIGKLC